MLYSYPQPLISVTECPEPSTKWTRNGTDYYIVLLYVLNANTKQQDREESMIVMKKS